MNLIRNNAVLFWLFEDEKPDATGKRLQAVGTIVFTITFGALVLASFLPEQNNKESLLFTILMWVASFGWVLGILLFIVVGTYYLGKAAGKKTFLQSSLHVLGKTFLYLLLPALLVTGLVVIWAVMTNQPAFR